GRNLVARDDDEQLALPSHLLIGRDRHLDPVGAAEVAALADDVERLLGDPCDQTVERLEFLVYLSEQRLIPSDPPCPLVHRRYSPRAALAICVSSRARGEAAAAAGARRNAEGIGENRGRLRARAGVR